MRGRYHLRILLKFKINLYCGRQQNQITRIGNEGKIMAYYKNRVMKAKLWQELATKLGIQDQFLYIQGGPKVSSLELPGLGPTE